MQHKIHAYFEDTPAEFEIETEREMAEPFSHGGSRGTYLTARATLRSLTLGGLEFNREQAVAMLGEAAVGEFETEAAENALEDA